MRACWALNVAAKMESWLFELCFGNLRGLGLKEGSLATKENKASAALLSGGICMIVGGAEFSWLALSLWYWLWMELVENVSLGAGNWDFFVWPLVMAAEVIEVGWNVIEGNRWEESFGMVFGRLGITLALLEKSEEALKVCRGCGESMEWGIKFDRDGTRDGFINTLDRGSAITFLFPPMCWILH